MSDYEYNYEINELAPRLHQPNKINLPLKEHQLACLYKAVNMEKNGIINYNFNSSININIKDRVICKTNIGILGDIVGYGKTITALSLIAANNDIHVNKEVNISFNSRRNYSYISYQTQNNNILSDVIQSTLIIVPRGPVYLQWLECLKKNTTLKYLAIDNLNFIKKNLPENKNNNIQEIIEYFNSFDVVLIKNTTLLILLEYYYISNSCTIDNEKSYNFIKKWKRIMIDESHDICNKIPDMYYEYLWLISGTYQNLLYSLRSYNNILYTMKDAINYDILPLLLVKCTKEFVRNSFKIPSPIEKYYICKMSARINIIRNFINSTILDKINANDISGAIKDLGGKSETEDNVIELVSKEIKREILNKEKEKEYISSLDINEETKNNKIKNIELEISNNIIKLKDLTERVSEFNKKNCSICTCFIEQPIILECTHSYCASCIMKWISTKMNCPECRKDISADKMIAVINDKNYINIDNTIKLLSKEDTLLKIIKDNPNGKFLVFSKYDSWFVKIMISLENNNITSSELKGNTSHMMNVLDKFKSGNIKVILLNTNYAGSGIDISFATDVIIFHSMGLAKYQAIGRAQRVGRKDTLNIHHLCYEHEMENDNIVN